MKLVVGVVMLIFSLGLQLFGQLNWLWLPNIVLIELVVLTLFLPLDNMLLLAAVIGLVSDYYSGSDFGFQLVFYVLSVAVAGIVFGRSERWRSVAIICLVSVGLQLSYIIMRNSYIFFESDFVNLRQLAIVTGLRLVVAAALSAGLYSFCTWLFSWAGNWSRHNKHHV